MFFSKRTIVIATMHDKERVIAPKLNKLLGLDFIVPKDFNSDELGTFSGEVDRKEDPISVARQKCKIAMNATQLDLAIASEGSFGPHPSIYFVPADEEILVFRDEKHGIEVISREVSVQTNFAAETVTNGNELMAFAKRVMFPSHGLILRPSKHQFQPIFKGITDWETLKSAFDFLKSQFSSVYVETDMRAKFNPSRMKVIEAATKKLVEKILNTCPQCNYPGYDVSSLVSGLPCEICKMPTRSTLAQIYSCQHCQFTSENKYPNGKEWEDPMYCDWCNP